MPELRQEAPIDGGSSPEEVPVLPYRALLRRPGGASTGGCSACARSAQGARCAEAAARLTGGVPPCRRVGLRAVRRHGDAAAFEGTAKSLREGPCAGIRVRAAGRAAGRAGAPSWCPGAVVPDAGSRTHPVRCPAAPAARSSTPAASEAASSERCASDAPVQTRRRVFNVIGNATKGVCHGGDNKR